MGLSHPAPSKPLEVDPSGFTTLFDFLPIGAYRSSPDGAQLRANPALVRLNGYTTESELIAAVGNIATEWYVDAGRRDRFRALLERDGQVTGFVSQVHRHRTRERIWVSENAHVVRDAAGAVLYYEGTVEEITHRVEAQAALQRNEELFRQIMEQIPAMVYRLRTLPTGQREFLYVSPGVRDLYGIEPQALVADPNLLKALRHPDDEARLAAELADAAATARPLDTEFRVVLADGTQKWAQIVSAPVSADERGVVRNGVMIDITRRKLAEAALREADERWKLALDSTGDGVWDWNVQTGDESVSLSFKAMYGYGPDDGLGRFADVDALTHPDDVPQMLIDRQAHFDGRAPAYVNEHRMRCRDGSWKWILTRGLVIGRDAQGKPLRMVGTHTDITAQKQAAALKQERDRAEAADRAKTQLLSRVSHELRTPLNAVLGFAQLLDGDAGLQPRHQDWVTRMLTSGRHLLSLVDDVLDMSSAHSGQLSLSCVPVDLLSVADESWAMLAARAYQAGIRLQRHAAESTPLMVMADPKRLLQVISNLLSNAIKYNRPGGEVRLDARRVDDGVEFSVQDSGRGIGADQLGKLFSPFERLGAQHTAIEGTGLGLALSKQLVEAMGGSIRADSEAGRGSTFTVRLQAARA